MGRPIHKQPHMWGFGNVPESYMLDEYVLPEQFFAAHPAWGPEQRLHVALLLEAYESWRRGRDRTVEPWLHGATADISFDDVCSSLHLIPAAVREAWFGGQMCRERHHRTGYAGRTHTRALRPRYT